MTQVYKYIAFQGIKLILKNKNVSEKHRRKIEIIYEENSVINVKTICQLVSIVSSTRFQW